MWNGTTLGLRQTRLAPAVPQPSLRCESLAEAATGFATVRPAASKQSVYQCAFSMAATASDPIRSDLRPKVLLQHSRLIMRADYRMFKKLRLWHDTNTLRRESMTGCNTNANRYERPFLFRTFYAINRTSWSSGLTFLLRIRDVRVQISAWRSAILTDVGRFPQSLQANAGIVP
jgi:hypothetical protein